ncbi:MAG: iron-sulfur cluster assembly accessory protein [Deltaproteobacteria bacterium]|nr:iron-sulfur cluster assembly accessory protein [Deltaproteobacteria bacterium]
MEAKAETITTSTPPEAKPEGAKSLAITITSKAAEAAKKQLAKRGTPEAMIRLGIRGSGCSGFSYVIEFEDKEPRERDRVFLQDGVKFVVDKKSLLYLAGTQLDWEQKLMSQGFKFVNPNEKSTCGCGHSFTV